MERKDTMGWLEWAGLKNELGRECVKTKTKTLS